MKMACKPMMMTNTQESSNDLTQLTRALCSTFSLYAADYSNV